jgi:hypothetical protein
MLGVIFRALALILFIVAACNQTLFSQPPADLVAWGLASWVLATLLAGVGPELTGWQRRPPA